VQTVPVDIFEPLMGLDIFRIVWKNIPTGMVFVLTVGGGGLVLEFVALATETVVLFLDDATNEILTSLAHQRFVRKRERRLVVLFQSKLELRQEDHHLQECSSWFVVCLLLQPKMVYGHKGTDWSVRTQIYPDGTIYLVQDDSYTPPVTTSIV
jgi:hypothetical protein